MNNREAFIIRPLFGIVDSNNTWIHNIYLKLTAEEQIEENRLNGWIIYKNERGVYKLRRRLPHIVKRGGLWELYDNRQAAMDAEWPIARCRKLESCYLILKDFNKRPNYV